MLKLEGHEIIIVGGGLAGSILALMLSEKYRQKICLVDNDYYRNASRVAAGIFNPITGKRMVKTWMADDIFPFMIDFYKWAEEKLNARFLHTHKVIKPFDTIAEQNEWTAKTAIDNYSDYVNVQIQNSDIGRVIDYKLGGIEVQNSGWLDCISFMEAVRRHFIEKGVFVNGKYDFEQDAIFVNGTLIPVHSTNKVVNCTGFQAAQNRLWEKLPWQLAKGEIITIETKETLENIVNKSVFVCPTSKANEYKVGATYIWNNLDASPTENGVLELTEKLSAFYKAPSLVIRSEAEVRPTVKDRKPFLGVHNEFNNQVIFNGFGSKTVSLGPYFAKHLAEYLLFQKPLMKEVDIQKYF